MQLPGSFTPSISRVGVLHASEVFAPWWIRTPQAERHARGLALAGDSGRLRRPQRDAPDLVAGRFAPVAAAWRAAGVSLKGSGNDRASVRDLG
jgi:hypothetical protein